MENINMKQVALDYVAQGIPVFPLWKNGKVPSIKGGNGHKDATTDTTVINQWWDKWPDANIGIPTGAETGWLVLDVDEKNGVSGTATLRELERQYGELPETRTHTTPSGGKHIFFKHPGYHVPGSKSLVGLGLDVRCDGGYVVAPQSVIDGVSYQVVDASVEIADAPEWLILKALGAKYPAGSEDVVHEGGRNDHLFKVAMGCNRQNLPYAEAEEVVAGANSKCVPPLQGKEVQRTLASAYRYEVGAIPPEILELNKTHAAIKMGSNCWVLEEITCPTFNRPDFELMSVKGFKDFYCNRYVEIEGKKQKLGEAWFGHPSRRQYQGLTFNPRTTPQGYYNIWKGFAVEPKEGDCSLYLKHIEENIANGDKAVYDYLIAWMAQVVQRPDELIGVAVVMRGSMGAGKGVFANEFGKLFGQHYMLLNDSSQLVGKFNGHMKEKCLLFADEAFWAGDKAAEGKLKSMITEPTINIEMKGKDAFTIKNNLHMMFATNNDWAAPAGPRERRFFIIDVGNKHLQDHQYFEAIGRQMDNGGREALLHYLMNYDISNMNLRQYPQTAALREAKQLSFTPVQKFWHHVLDTGKLHCSLEDGWGDGVIMTEYLYQSYQKFVQDVGLKHKATDIELGMQLKVMVPSDSFKKEKRSFGLPGSKKTERKNCYVFPSLEECRKGFERFINTEMNWPTE
ncbi:bifunctional DNA primase/polymerase [Geomonas edaphica]|uniref:bifunctional DNA primase/polymerase n=1 Tax=Geomonas edaphica TaxID=2570226 RepID=UPI0010A7D883|nr:bifunctional DNA primase/polymerase [Geomonas edaphica]